MRKPIAPKHSLEPLEQRIAPAGLLNEAGFRTVLNNTPLLLTAGQGLATGGPNSGSYMLYVEKGTALIFTTDLNNNDMLDSNEITGIAAGDGLRMISFVDIQGDIVTNLRPDTKLSDSDNDSSNNDDLLAGDGRVLLPSRIEKIELRSLTIADIGDQDGIGIIGADGKIIPDQNDVNQRLALSSFSIHGNILAGGGFGVPGDATSGLIINDVTGGSQAGLYIGGIITNDFYITPKPSIGSIKTGTAASGTFFSFGASAKSGEIKGRISTFVPSPGQSGGDIANVLSVSPGSMFNLDSIEAGDGGLGARGGNISDVRLAGDSAGGYRIIAGDGGRGVNGGAGGNIVNLSDLGSVTGNVLIRTGDGGNASTGAGGNGGNLTFGSGGAIGAPLLYAVNGDVEVRLGSGGDGFTVGGNGASLNSGIVVTPVGAGTFGVNIVANTRENAEAGVIPTNVQNTIGTRVPVDFNEVTTVGGVTPGDYVFASASPDQLVVAIDGGATLIHLDSPVWDDLNNPTSVVVGDFNDDGHMDIAAASSAAAAFGGIYVWLNQFEDSNGDGILSQTEDLDKDNVNDFLGFSGPIRSPLPFITPLFNRSGTAVGDLTTGDFDGDGHTDLGVVVTYHVPSERQVVLFMSPDLEDHDGLAATPPRATGEFYANFGSKAQPGGIPRTDFQPYYFFPPFNSPTENGLVKIEATAGPRVALPGQAPRATHDILFAARVGGVDIFAIDFSQPAVTFAPTFLGTWNLGRVDTDRADRVPTDAHINLANATMRDFVVTDISAPIPNTGTFTFVPDGIADLVILTEAPSADFLVAIAGDATGNVSPDAGTKISDVRGDALQNAGIALAGGANVTRNIGTPMVQIRATDIDGDGRDDIAVLDYRPAPTFRVQDLRLTPRALTTDIGAAPQVTITRTLPPPSTLTDDTVIAWDSYTPNLRAPGVVGYVAARALKATNNQLIHLEAAGLTAINYIDHGIDFFAGDGGNALVGRGGNGGSIGGGLTTIQGVVVGALDVSLIPNVAIVTFTAGAGGNGFSTGGNGGNINGLQVRTPFSVNFSTVSLTAGAGGFGVSGAGGKGGDLKSNSIQDGVLFTAGNGGRGLIGGAGGSILGNGLPNYFDASLATRMTLNSGLGGAGIKAGGAGGDVRNFAPEFDQIEAAVQDLIIFAGDGGSAISGPGGRGGSIDSIRPLSATNVLNGEIYLEAGDGGLGVTGGAGGSVRNFVNNPSQADNPIILSFLAGHGGAGTLGNGGAGGSVENIVTPSIGTNSLLNAIPPSITRFDFDRVLAGNGGNSAGAAGGAGGRVTGISVDATDGQLAIAAGAGGLGVTVGGAGGSVLNTNASVGGSLGSKLLVIAGKGGDVTGVIPNPNDPATNQHRKSFGGKVGKAGDGGSISAFRQELGIATRVDLIAGNGGDSLNYGTISPTEKFFVGKGGSVTNVQIAGSFGNSDPVVPLRSYNSTGDANNDGRIDQTIAEFVQQNLRDTPAGPLTDDFGNVGIIVGAAGRVKVIKSGVGPGGRLLYDSQPATAVPNGSLLDVRGRDLAAAVAGSIDSIAAISVVSGLRIGFQAPGGGAFSPGTVGADKSVIGANEYFTKSGVIVTAPQLDGRLLDGAVVTRKLIIKPGDPNPAPRVFIL